MTYCQMGHYFVMQMVQNGHKLSMKQKVHSKLHDNELEVITYTGFEKQIHWEEEGDEFFFQGEMYDLVRLGYENGKTLLYCINDKKEKELAGDYKDATHQNSGKKAKTSTNQITLFFDRTELITLDAVTGEATYHDVTNFSLPFVVLPLIAPPPRPGYLFKAA